MDQTSKLIKDEEAIAAIKSYITSSEGLELNCTDGECLKIHQKTDGRAIRIESTHIEEVLCRQDIDGREFLQVNFIDDKKILLTDKLIGFKPVETVGLDVRKLPRVVTTPDLISVIEAIEESLTTRSKSDEIDVLRRVFDSVLQGAEAVGFDLTAERSWLNLIANIKHRPSA